MSKSETVRERQPTNCVFWRRQRVSLEAESCWRKLGSQCSYPSGVGGASQQLWSVCGRRMLQGESVHCWLPLPLADNGGQYCGCNRRKPGIKMEAMHLLQVGCWTVCTETQGQESPGGAATALTSQGSREDRTKQRLSNTKRTPYSVPIPQPHTALKLHLLTFLNICGSLFL